MNTQTNVVETIIDKIQEYASAWSLVGSRFDGGHALEDAHKSRDELHAMIRRAFADAVKDAARYRWLRTRVDTKYDAERACLFVNFHSSNHASDRLAEFDKSIDSARSAVSPEVTK